MYECKGSVHPEKGQSNCSEFANVLNVQELSLNCPSSGAIRERLFRCGTSNYYYSVAKFTLTAQPIYQYAPCRLPICNERQCAATKIISNSFFSSSLCWYRNVTVFHCQYRCRGSWGPIGTRPSASPLELLISSWVFSAWFTLQK